LHGSFSWKACWYVLGILAQSEGVIIQHKPVTWLGSPI